MDRVGEAFARFQAAQAGIDRAKERAAQVVADARAAAEQARLDLAAAIASEYGNGARVSDLARRSNYTREHVRRILRAAGYEAE
ncbi:hypothetical protein [Asanoa iriomotensis]|uniref:Uncharacterized protein n=1 Tax=Asanoa iriomotensis TaxID=234613 RepID=A0ABQ4CET9_9ACTN|nr:hypothetical protein [Asanoa iriomotensis]GIF61275.1 hypothetical protein Air01nite_73700 [Asanoa iriomotensis]